MKKDLDGKPCGTLVEYNIALIILPMGVVGAAFGAFVSLILPEIINTMIFSITLTLLFYTTLSKLVKMCKKESASAKEKKVEMAQVAAKPDEKQTDQKKTEGQVAPDF